LDEKLSWDWGSCRELKIASLSSVVHVNTKIMIWSSESKLDEMLSWDWGSRRELGFSSLSFIVGVSTKLDKNFTWSQLGQMMFVRCNFCWRIRI
jgi:hypothetical protein